jgi:hypothetical protein
MKAAPRLPGLPTMSVFLLAALISVGWDWPDRLIAPDARVWSKKEVVNRVSDEVLEVPIMLPASSAMAFDDLGDCDSDICGDVFSVKSECRSNLEFEHAIRRAPAFLPSA